jgi:hypothetical protein
MKTSALPPLFTRNSAENWRTQVAPTLPASPVPVYSPAESVAYIERQMWRLLTGMGVLLSATYYVAHYLP